MLLLFLLKDWIQEGVDEGKEERLSVVGVGRKEGGKRENKQVLIGVCQGGRKDHMQAHAVFVF